MSAFISLLSPATRGFVASRASIESPEQTGKSRFLTVLLGVLSVMAA